MNLTCTLSPQPLNLLNILKHIVGALWVPVCFDDWEAVGDPGDLCFPREALVVGNESTESPPNRNRTIYTHHSHCELWISGPVNHWISPCGCKYTHSHDCEGWFRESRKSLPRPLKQQLTTEHLPDNPPKVTKTVTGYAIEGRSYKEHQHPPDGVATHSARSTALQAQRGSFFNGLEEDFGTVRESSPDRKPSESGKTTDSNYGWRYHSRAFSLPLFFPVLLVEHLRP